MNRLNRMYDRLCMKIAWLLPKKILMWCYIKIAADVTTNDNYSHMNIPDMKMMDCIKWWSREQGWPGHGSALNDLENKLNEIEKMTQDG